MDELSENLIKEIKNIKKSQSGLKDMIIEMKNIPHRMNSRLEDVKEWI